MPMSEEEWASVSRFVELEVGKLIGRRRDPLFTAKVTKRDEENKLVWVKELGDQPIPILAFDYEVTYFDESPRGTSGGGSYKTYKKTATVDIIVPQIGQLVIIAREMSYDGHPRCLGVVKSRNYIQDLEDI